MGPGDKLSESAVAQFLNFGHNNNNGQFMKGSDVK